MTARAPGFKSSVPLVWDEAGGACGSRSALAGILESARGIAGARGSCIALLQDAALEVLCAHGITRSEFLDAFGGCGTSLISIPFLQGRRGALCLFHLGAPHMSELDLQWLECLAAQAELALDVARQHQAIAQLHASLNQASDAAADEPLLIEDAQLPQAGAARRVPTSA